MKGIIALHGHRMNNSPWRIKKRPKKPMFKLCSMCHINKIPHGRQVYCGSWRKKTGCSLLMKQIWQRSYITSYMRTWIKTKRGRVSYKKKLKRERLLYKKQRSFNQIKGDIWKKR